VPLAPSGNTSGNLFVDVAAVAAADVAAIEVEDRLWVRAEVGADAAVIGATDAVAGRDGVPDEIVLVTAVEL
jgi:hypothetical protein